MEKESKTQVETTEQEISFTRIFDASRELVFETFSDCKHLKHWWGPRTWPLSYCDIDFRPGGSWHYCMSGPNEGDNSWGKVLYKEIYVPERIVFEDYFSDKDGNINKEMPGTLATVEFVEHEGKTKVINRSEYQKAADLQKVLDMGMVEGFTETLDRLEEYLSAITG